MKAVGMIWNIVYLITFISVIISIPFINTNVKKC